MGPTTDLLDKIVPLVKAAGRAVMDVYDGDIEVHAKADGSPVTAADRIADGILREGLSTAFPDVPVVSEEAAVAPYGTRRGWSSFFLVDPLDGTKEFVRRNGEFTVNVALVRAGDPVAGVVGLPAQDVVYGGVVGGGAMRADPDGLRAIRVTGPRQDAPLRVVSSRSHPDEETARFLSRLPAHKTIACGSSLKICQIAEGAADVYPRFGPTMEWDVAAAHAVLSAAGGRVLRLPDGDRFVYNKPDLLNPGFIATGPFDPLPYLLPAR